MTYTHRRRAAVLGGFLCASCQMVANIAEYQPQAVEATSSPLCDQYCAIVRDECTERYAVYHDDAQCKSVCKLFPAGDVTHAQHENTAACRYAVASRLGGERSDCWIASPSGGNGGEGTCADGCDSYCLLMSKACSAYPQYWLNDLDKCKAACRGLHDLAAPSEHLDPRYSVLDDDSRDRRGDTLQCRLYHVSAAADGAADHHCWHAALSPVAEPSRAAENPCAGTGDLDAAPSCDDYCRIVTVACTGDFAIFDDQDQCQRACRANLYAPGKIIDDRVPGGDMPPDTLGCRYTHAYAALMAEDDRDRGEQCAAASPSGNGVCGRRCDTFCNQLANVCTDRAGALADFDTCRATCQGFNGEDRQAPYSIVRARKPGNAYSCRLHAVTQAHADASSQAIYCDAALGKSTCP